jgi:chromosome segregation ATPase
MTLYLLFALLTLTALMLVATRNQMVRVQKQLNAGALGYSILDENHKKALTKITSYEAKFADLANENKKLENMLAESHLKKSLLETEFLTVKNTLERKLVNVELQRDHILAKYETLQHEIMDIKAEAQESIEEFKRSLPKIDPEELETLRRRALKNEQLFHIMRGHREMAEERNRNWESALRKLSTWILTSSSVATRNDPVPSNEIGPLVGEALARIGQSIMEVSPMEEIRAEKYHVSSVEM